MKKIITPNAFSLVELMVVIAIIGILSAIAVPSYKTYIIRSKFTELLSLVGPYQIETAEAFNATGSPPANRLDVKNSALVMDIQLWQNNGIEFIHIHPQNFFPECISTACPPLIFAGKLQDEILTWTCCIHPTVPIPAKYLPSNCQTTCVNM